MPNQTLHTILRIVVIILIIFLLFQLLTNASYKEYRPTFIVALLGVILGGMILELLKQKKVK